MNYTIANELEKEDGEVKKMLRAQYLQQLESARIRMEKVSQEDDPKLRAFESNTIIKDLLSLLAWHSDPEVEKALRGISRAYTEATYGCGDK